MNEESFANRNLYRGFEGGAVYTVEENGDFLVIIDESAMADFLHEEDITGLELIKVITFNAEFERRRYLNKRFGPMKLET